MPAKPPYQESTMPLVVHPGMPGYAQLQRLLAGLRPKHYRPTHPHMPQHHPVGTGGVAIAPRHHAPVKHRPQTPIYGPQPRPVAPVRRHRNTRA